MQQQVARHAARTGLQRANFGQVKAVRGQSALLIATDAERYALAASW